METHLPAIIDAPALKSPMRHRRWIGVLAACALLLLSTGMAEAKPIHWEYQVVNAQLNNRQLETLLNRIGAEGWELVQINPQGHRYLQAVDRLEISGASIPGNRSPLPPL